MFKLIKIINAKTNIPEVCYIPTERDTEYKRGSALTISSGRLVNAGANDQPVYIAAEDKKANEGERLLCFPITSNMIFDTKIVGDTEGLSIGKKLMLHTENGYATGVCMTDEGGIAELYDMTEGDSIVSIRFRN